MGVSTEHTHLLSRKDRWVYVHDTVYCNLQSGRTAILIACGHVTVGLHKKSINGVQQRVPCSSSYAK